MMKKVPDVARQGIIDKLILIGHVPGNNGNYATLFERAYPKCKDIDYDGRNNLLGAIARHMDIFSDDWGSDNELFSQVNILDWSDDDFLYFCQEYVNPVFYRFEFDEDAGERIDLQPKCVEAINSYLRDCGYELREAQSYGDKTTYELVTISGVKGAIQGIVFAAVGKPDLVFTDFLNQDVRIPENNDRYLYYDKKVDTNGLRWKDLKEWYDNQFLLDGGLMERLRKSVQHCGSPIEETFFSAYLETVREYGDEIPALLPQVYLYYDSKVQKERLKKIFDHQCMDFLMLISESRRIVFELDGIQHYAGSEEYEVNGNRHAHIASVDKYASMVSAQRDMTLAGYEVYRFGGKELYSESGKNLVKSFFRTLFEKYGIVEK